VKRVDSSGGQMTSCLPFHKKAADEFGGDQLGGAGEEVLEECWEGLGGYGSGYGSGSRL